jgi:nicotinate-nucleotide adenylyltransferase
MRVGILGGTFNPIHNAHRYIAEAALRHCQLDQVLFLPAAIPPHKEIADEVSFDHRLAMVELAIADNPAFTSSDLESKRSGASFSVDTLSHLKETQPTDEFFFIIGLDSFRDITTWKEYRRLFELTNVVVASRPGPGDDDPQQFLPVAIKDDFCYDERSLKLRHKSGCELIFIHDTRLDISSTLIRQIVAQGKSIRDYVSQPVIDYIEQNGLYRSHER